MFPDTQHLSEAIFCLVLSLRSSQALTLHIIGIGETVIVSAEVGTTFQSITNTPASMI